MPRDARVAGQQILALRNQYAMLAALLEIGCIPMRLSIRNQGLGG